MASLTSEDRSKEIMGMALKPAPGLDDSDELKGQYSFARFAVQGDHYVGFYQTWVKAILFLLGRHWMKWMNGQRRFTTDTSVPPWKQQPVTNICYAVYRSIATKLTKQKPTLEVVPPSGDSVDRESAGLGSSLLEFLWRKLKFPATIRRAIGWFITTGQVYLRVHFDTDAGDMVPLTSLEEVPHSDEALAAAGETMDVEVPLDDQGQPMMKDDPDTGEKVFDLDAEPAMVPEGEIALGVVDPLCVRLNPEAICDEDAYEMFVATLWPKSEAMKHFKVTEQDLNSGGDGDRQMYDDLISSAAAGPGWLTSQGLLGSQIGSSQDTALGDRVLVIEYYSRQFPRKFPNGRHWISIGTTKVWPKADDKDYPNGEAPLPNGFWPPLIPVKDLPIPGQPQAMGALPQVVPLNEQYNQVDAKIIEHNVMMAMGGKWVVHPDDKGLTINSDPGQVLASKGYAMGKPPIQVELKELPAAVYAERNVIIDKVRLVMSLSEAEMGRKPEGVSAGRAFLVLQEVTDSVIGPSLEAWEHALEEVGRRCLVLAQRHYREQRKIQIRGERGAWEVRSFDGADLVDGLDVRVQVGSSFPWSKSAQWDTKLEVLGKFPGLVQNPQTGQIDRELFAQFLDTGSTGLAGFESDEDPDLVEIQREHAMFEAYNPEKGVTELPQLAFWQAHPKHLEGHFRFMKRDYARYLRWHPAAKKAFEQHMQQTVQAVDELAGLMQGAMGGGAAPGASVEEGAGGPALSLVKGPADQVPPGGAMTRPSLQRADFAAAGQG